MRDVGRKRALWQGVFGFATQFTLYGAMALILYVAQQLYKRDKVTIGTISSFLFYLLALLFNFFILNFTFANVANIMGASDKIFKIINKKPKVNVKGGICMPEDMVIEGNIELKDVKFHYPSKPDV